MKQNIEYAITSDLSISEAANSSKSCKTCEQMFVSEEDLYAHNRQKHPEKRHKCVACCKEFLTETGFLTHCVSHTDQAKKRKYANRQQICSDFPNKINPNQFNFSYFFQISVLNVWQIFYNQTETNCTHQNTYRRKELWL